MPLHANVMLGKVSELTSDHYRNSEHSTLKQFEDAYSWKNCTAERVNVVTIGTTNTQLLKHK